MTVIPGLPRNPVTLKARLLDTGFRRYDRECGFYNVVLSNEIFIILRKKGEAIDEAKEESAYGKNSESSGYGYPHRIEH